MTYCRRLLGAALVATMFPGRKREQELLAAYRAEDSAGGSTRGA